MIEKPFWFKQKLLLLLIQRSGVKLSGFCLASMAKINFRRSFFFPFDFCLFFLGKDYFLVYILGGDSDIYILLYCSVIKRRQSIDNEHAYLTKG